MIPIRNKRTDISSEVASGRKLQEKIKFLATEAANKSIDEGIELDSVIAEISKREGFNRLQIQRLVEESNIVAYNKRYDKLRSSNDRRISFPIASLDGVVNEMGADAPEEIQNPNMASGGAGGGSITKAASVSIEPSYIHNPNGKLQEREEKYKKKLEAMKNRRTEQEKKAEEKEYNSTLFKVANSLVMTEKVYKTANELFNTMLSDVSLPNDAIEGIVKKASEISSQLVKTRRANPAFMVTLTEDSTEKVASHLLGEYSLLKVASSDKVKPVKVQPTVDVSDYQQLIRLAQKLQNNINQPTVAGNEVKSNEY